MKPNALNSNNSIPSPLPRSILDEFSMLFSHYFDKNVKYNLFYHNLNNLTWFFEGPINSSLPRPPLFPPRIKLDDVFDQSNFDQIVKTILLNWYQVSIEDRQNFISNFLDYLFQFNLFNLILERLHYFKVFEKDKNEFCNCFKEIWFNRFKWTKYADKSNINYSKSELDKLCGFEHVYLGQKKRNKVKGLHCWKRYFILERQGKIVLNDIHKKHHHYHLASLKFTWDNYLKNYGTIFFGLPVELEILVFTVAFLIRCNQPVQFLIDGYPITIQTYDVAFKENTLATAFMKF